MWASAHHLGDRRVFGMSCIARDECCLAYYDVLAMVGDIRFHICGATLVLLGSSSSSASDSFWRKEVWDLVRKASEAWAKYSDAVE